MDYPISDPGSQLYNNKFTDGDQSQGVAASLDKSAHMNAVYDEILSVITGMGLTPEESDTSQLIQALRVLSPKTKITFHFVNLADPDPVPGWLLCDGSNGTPNLLDRFIVGAGGAYAVGDVGGSNTKASSTSGAHSHPVTVDNHTLTEAEMPSHYHVGGRGDGGSGDGEFGTTHKPDAGRGYETTQPSQRYMLNTSTEGGDGAHNHSASSASAGDHAHNVDVRPPYYALAPFILASYAAELAAP